MSEVIQPQTRTAEQLEAVRRRALPVALAGMVFGIVGIVMLVMTDVGVRRPPNILAANLSFAAIMMGVGILYYARGTAGGGTRLARWLCVGAIVTGLAGPAIFARQSLEWHRAMEDREAQNAATIAAAAGKFAAEHEGKYPEDFLELVRGKYLEGDSLLSPFGGSGSDYMGSLKTPLTGESRAEMIAAHSDYTYTGADLRLPLAADAAAKLVVVYETDPVMREHYAVGFADGKAKFCTIDDAHDAMMACNEVRKGLKLVPLDDPESVKRAMAAEGGH